MAAQLAGSNHATQLKAKHLNLNCYYIFTTVQVSPNSHAMTLVGSDTIAGSCCTMLEILHNLVHVLDVPVGQAVAMLSENPARSVLLHMSVV